MTRRSGPKAAPASSSPGRHRQSTRLAEAAEALEESRRTQAEATSQAPSLFDPPPPLEQEAAIESVTSHAPNDYIEDVVRAVQMVAQLQPELTVDDLHSHITTPVYDKRAMGGAIREAAKRGLIRRRPGAYKTSERRETHSRPLAVWESRIYSEARSAPGIATNESGTPARRRAGDDRLGDSSRGSSSGSGDVRVSHRDVDSGARVDVQLPRVRATLLTHSSSGAGGADSAGGVTESGDRVR